MRAEPILSIIEFIRRAAREMAGAASGTLNPCLGPHRGPESHGLLSLRKRQPLRRVRAYHRDPPAEGLLLLRSRWRDPACCRLFRTHERVSRPAPKERGPQLRSRPCRQNPDGRIGVWPHPPPMPVFRAIAYSDSTMANARSEQADRVSTRERGALSAVVGIHRGLPSRPPAPCRRRTSRFTQSGPKTDPVFLRQTTTTRR